MYRIVYISPRLCPSEIPRIPAQQIEEVLLRNECLDTTYVELYFGPGHRKFDIYKEVNGEELTLKQSTEAAINEIISNCGITDYWADVQYVFNIFEQAAALAKP